jgi:putative endonuclease
MGHPRFRHRRRHGRWGEIVAAWFLRAQGWSIVARNIRLAGVEVDLVARRGGVDALVEVKTRRPRAGSAPPWDHVLTRAQAGRLARAAAAWAGRHRDRRVRVDLVRIGLVGLLPRAQRLADVLERQRAGPA